MPDTVIRVAVVDDQPLFSSGLRMLIEAQTDMECVGTALNGQEAVALTERGHPDIVLMDLRMPVMNGLDAIRTILAGPAVDEPPRVIVLTTIQKDEAVFHALQAGASAFLTKDATPDDVLATIRNVNAGHAITAPTDSLGLVHEFARPQESPRREAALTTLSPREREVFLMVARGLSNAETADAAYLSEATVKSHVRSILHKLELRSRIHIVIFAYENNLVTA
jgi:DNA-binding NarL/FixJ family response regulator